MRRFVVVIAAVNAHLSLCPPNAVPDAIAPALSSTTGRACAETFDLPAAALLTYDNFTAAQIDMYATSPTCEHLFGQVMAAIGNVTPECVLPHVGYTTVDVSRLTFAQKVEALRRRTPLVP
ncbi:hypothetical protein ACHHYP_06275 [Achlya hypogyna]|uniref:Secreted protein n=1 Tax=Achlya hypogyna TaxID=1202772 RepID=A0A1V9YUP5_ACHHY|nr:hypothetical protein ACHHYP_06275 [Achlya hypogyna]